MAVRTAPLPSTEPRGHLAPGGRRATGATVAVASLVLLPLVTYAVPALFGHPVVPGDDTTQSLPLRQLVGRDLAAGHLPVFDPYLWGGTPLLAGWNAGAAYPFTWLFAVLPGAAAWTVTLASAATAAGVGCYAFLRANALGVVASWLGALTFAFGGGMAAQVSHIGLVAGMAWVPLALLAILRLTRPAVAAAPAVAPRRGEATCRRLERLGRSAGWAAVLAAAVGLVVLAGEPRAVADAAAVLVLYGGWRLVRLVGAARRSDDRPALTIAWGLAGVVAGGVLGVGLGAVQLVPGLAAVATSQRAAVTPFLFSAGSLPAPWLLLLGVPDLLGGSGSLGQPRFFATYNLTEVTGYVGMLPLVAVGSLLGRLRRRQPVPEWAVWYVVAVAGVLLALGTNTPLWHLLIHVPLFGGQRLQSRSILVTGLALAVLLAYWADGWIAGPGGAGAPRRQAGPRWREAGPGWREAAPGWREAALGSLLPVAVIVVVVVGLAWRVPLLEWLAVPGPVAAQAGAIGPWLVPFLVLAVAAIALVWAGWVRGRRAPAFGDGLDGHDSSRPGGRVRARAGILAIFVVVDLVVFAATSVVALGGAGSGTASIAAGASASARPAERRAPAGPRLETGGTRPIATLRLGGRFAVYDPTLLDATALSVLGVPDANVLAGTYSVEGYGSIVDGHYAAATGTHGVSGGGQDVFTPKAAGDGVLDALDTTDVLVPDSYLVAPAGDHAGPSAAARSGRRAGAGAGPGADGRMTTPGGRATWELGTPLSVTGVVVTAQPGTHPQAGPAGGSHPAGPGPPGVGIGLVRADGHVAWASSVTATQTATGPGRAWRATWSAGVHAVGVVVASADGGWEAPLVTTASGTRLRPAGPLDAVLVPPHWRYAGQDGPFAVYRNERARRPLSLEPVAGHGLAGASVARSAGPALEPLPARVSSPHGVWVVRAVAAIPGWSATWTPAGSGVAVPLALRRHGVVQSVRVPQGRGTLTWRYRAPGLRTGGILSGAALVTVLALATVATLGAVGRRRDRKREGGRGPRGRRLVASQGSIE